MYAFDYRKPSSVADAVAALQAAEDAKFVAGGMTLIPTLKQRLAQPSDLIDLGGVRELAGITVAGDTLTIGAMNTHATVANSRDVAGAIPATAALARHLGDTPVRNPGTIGGPVAQHDQAADYPAPRP